MGKIADILVKAGHEVVVYQPVYNENITKSGTELARVIERPRDFEPPVNFYSSSNQQNIWSVNEPTFKQELSAVWTIGKMFYSGLAEICKRKLFTDKNKRFFIKKS
uniref:Uncharacterized protein n=1 Tax=Acrobeloides nanus TaxID=290746 RepID=A0A914E552_9BILA